MGAWASTSVPPRRGSVANSGRGGSSPRPASSRGGTDTMQSAADFGPLDKKSQKDVQSFIEQQQQIQQIQAIVGKITELCWDKCVSKPGKDLTDTERQCIANCSERFLDTSMFVVNRIQSKQQQTAKR